MKIKICGLSRTEDIEYANEVLPDYIGFVFAKSRRQVSPEKAAELKSLLDSRISAVGVFVNADIDFIADMVHNSIIDCVQLHGNEDREYVKLLKSRIPDSIPLIKAFSVSSSENISRAVKFPCDYMLLDNGCGGTGKAFSWELLSGNMPEKVFLAGGITCENISEAVRLKPFCIDVSSGAETNGVKDRNKMLALTDCVRKNSFSKIIH